MEANDLLLLNKPKPTFGKKHSYCVHKNSIFENLDTKNYSSCAKQTSNHALGSITMVESQIARFLQCY